MTGKSVIVLDYGSGNLRSAQRALLRDNSLTHGKISVKENIGISGRVKHTAIDGPPQFRSLEPCIKEVVGRWAFPPAGEEYGTDNEPPKRYLSAVGRPLQFSEDDAVMSFSGSQLVFCPVPSIAARTMGRARRSQFCVAFSQQVPVG